MISASAGFLLSRIRAPHLAVSLWVIGSTQAAAAGGTPGPILETISFTNLPTFLNAEIRIAASIERSLLAAGATYWVTASAPGGSEGAQMQWLLSPSSGHLENRAISRDGGPWEIITNNGSVGAVRIVGTTVPEPGSRLLLVTAVAAWGRRRSARRRLVPV